MPVEWTKADYHKLRRGCMSKWNEDDLKCFGKLDLFQVGPTPSHDAIPFFMFAMPLEDILDVSIRNQTVLETLADFAWDEAEYGSDLDALFIKLVSGIWYAVIDFDSQSKYFLVWLCYEHDALVKEGISAGIVKSRWFRKPGKP